MDLNTELKLQKTTVKVRTNENISANNNCVNIVDYDEKCQRCHNERKAFL